jgi:hypothetical protein
MGRARKTEPKVSAKDLDVTKDYSFKGGKTNPFMKNLSDEGLSRRQLLKMGLTATTASLLTAGVEFALPPKAYSQDQGPLPSWNDGPARKAILSFVHTTTDSSSPKFVPPEQRIATFDQDGTLWVEHIMYSQVVYCFDRVPQL